jgi:F-type H+-transporting ATPase subunit b
MRFDLTSFLFQIINFVVLLFILKKLLYKPVREIIAQRRGLIAKTVQDAEKAKQDALELKEKYREEMGKLEDLRDQTLETLRKEVMEERKKLIGRAEEEAGKVREKQNAILEAEKRRLYAELKDQAIDTVCIFASRLLKDVSDEALHETLYRKLLKGLEEIVSDLAHIQEKEVPLTIELATAYPLNGEASARFRQTLESLLSRKVTVDTTLDETLIAGTRIKAYDKVYNYSLSGQIDLLRMRLKETE